MHGARVRIILTSEARGEMEVADDRVCIFEHPF